MIMQAGGRRWGGGESTCCTSTFMAWKLLRAVSPTSTRLARVCSLSRLHLSISLAEATEEAMARARLT